MAKPSVYVPDGLLAACRRMYHPASVSELVQAGLIHVIARGPEPSPADVLRARMAIEGMQRHPNKAWLKAADHALHTRSAARFLKLDQPSRRVPS